MEERFCYFFSRIEMIVYLWWARVGLFANRENAAAKKFIHFAGAVMATAPEVGGSFIGHPRVRSNRVTRERTSQLCRFQQHHVRAD